jgi:hypothetical protein
LTFVLLLHGKAYELTSDTPFLQIAESYWYLHTQHRSAFTQELDLRPFVEKF